MKTRFMTMNSPRYEKKYFDSLAEAVKESDEVYEVDENGKQLLWLWQDLPEEYWHIVES